MVFSYAIKIPDGSFSKRIVYERVVAVLEKEATGALQECGNLEVREAVRAWAMRPPTHFGHIGADQFLCADRPGLVQS